MSDEQNQQPVKNFVELDFYPVRESLKSYLKSQDRFVDYDFDGSNMSILLDVLAFAAQRSAFQGNMLASEKMMRLVQHRRSAVELAQNVSYTPRSRRSSRAIVSFEIVPVEGYEKNTFILPAQTLFTARIDNETFNFEVEDEHVIEADSEGRFFAREITIVEGKHFNYSQTLTTDAKTVTLPNEGVDTTRIGVFVKSAPGATPFEYEQARDFSTTKSDARVYFVSEVDGQRHQIYFGDDNIGHAPPDGSTVSVDYYRSRGSAPNGARRFSLSSPIPDSDRILSLVTNAPAFGGAEIEEIKSIQLRAPRHWTRQGMLSTPGDFVGAIEDIYPNARDIIAWGGEENTPPLYRYMLLSIIPENGFIFSGSARREIEKRFKAKYSRLSIEPLLVNPNFTFVRPRFNVRYSSDVENPGVATMRSRARARVVEFKNENLNKFDAVIYRSPFEHLVNSSHPAILSTQVDIDMYVRTYSLGDLQSDGIRFQQRIVPETLRSDPVGYRQSNRAILVDDGRGRMKFVERNVETGVETLIHRNVATVNYDSGHVEFDASVFTINDMRIDPLLGFVLNGTPLANDIESTNNQVIDIADEDIEISFEDTVTGLIS